MDPRGQSTWPEFFGPYENAFVFAKNHGDHQAFNTESTISVGLKELLFIYPGSFRPAADAKTKFTSLVTLEKQSGKTAWDQLTFTPSQVVNRLNQRTGKISRDETKRRSQITGEDLSVLNPSPLTALDDNEHIVAAHVQSEEELSLIHI